MLDSFKVPMVASTEIQSPRGSEENEPFVYALRRQGTNASGFSSFSSQKDAIVFDPNRRTLIKDDKGVIQEHKDQYIEVKLTGRNCVVPISIRVGPARREVYLGKVDLSTLGWTVKWQRTRKQIDTIYVLGQIQSVW